MVLSNFIGVDYVEILGPQLTLKRFCITYGNYSDAQNQKVTIQNNFKNLVLMTRTVIKCHMC